MVSLVVNDIFDQLIDENKRLNCELIFANKCLKLLIEMKDLLIKFLTSSNDKTLGSKLFSFDDISVFMEFEKQFQQLLRENKTIGENDNESQEQESKVNNCDDLNHEKSSDIVDCNHQKEAEENSRQVIVGSDEREGHNLENYTNSSLQSDLGEMDQPISKQDNREGENTKDDITAEGMVNVEENQTLFSSANSDLLSDETHCFFEVKQNTHILKNNGNNETTNKSSIEVNDISSNEEDENDQIEKIEERVVSQEPVEDSQKNEMQIFDNNYNQVYKYQTLSVERENQCNDLDMEKKMKYNLRERKQSINYSEQMEIEEDLDLIKGRIFNRKRRRGSHSRHPKLEKVINMPFQTCPPSAPTPQSTQPKPSIVKPKLFICSAINCKKVFTNELLFKCHKRSHHGSNWIKMEFKCRLKPADRRQFSRTGSVLPQKTDSHERRDADFRANSKAKKSTKLKCPFKDCDFQFVYKNRLRRHYQKKHAYLDLLADQQFKELMTEISDQSPKHLFNCKICGKRYMFENSLTRHLEEHQMSFNCDVQECHASFSTQLSLRRHKAFQHSSEPVFNCNYCSAAFLIKKGLDRHMNIHLERYVCDVIGCQYRAQEMYHLDRHKENKHKL